MPDYLNLPILGTALEVLEGEDCGLTVASSSSGGPGTFCRNMRLAMEQISHYVSPVMTAADVESIDYAKFQILLTKISEFFDTLVRNTKVSSLEYMLLVTECIVRSSDDVKKRLFHKMPHGKTKMEMESPGQFILVKWLAYALNVMEHKHRSGERNSDEDSVEEMVISSIMNLLCSMCKEGIVQKSAQIDIIKTKYGIDWAMIVEKTLSCARSLNSSSVMSSATRAQHFLDLVRNDAQLETFEPPTVLPYRVTLSQRTLNTNREADTTTTRDSANSSTVSNETNRMADTTTTHNSSSSSTESYQWSLYPGMTPKLAGKVNRTPKNSNYSAHETDHHSNHKRDANDALNGNKKRSRSEANFPSRHWELAGQGRGVIPELMTPHERARQIQPESMPVAVLPRTSNAHIVSTSQAFPVASGQGRGRGRPIPAWMSRDGTSPLAASSGSYASLSTGRSPHQDTPYGNNASTMSTSTVGVGRGIDRTRPAWQTSAPIDRPAGRGRGREMTKPAWLKE